MSDPYSRAYRRSMHRDLLRAAAIALDGLACLFAISAIGGLWKLWQGTDPLDLGGRLLALLMAAAFVVLLARAADWLRAAERADRADDE